MLFVTRDFLLGFLPIVWVAFHTALAFGFRKQLLPMLLVASIVFYAWGNPAYTPILVASILVNYFTGRALADREPPRSAARPCSSPASSSISGCSHSSNTPTSH